MEANGVAIMASGDVRFTFRSDETDVNVTIEGKGHGSKASSRNLAFLRSA